MLDGGEDPMFIARRLAIQASEDVGNADPQALILAMATLEAVARIGLPEAAIPLAQATIYVAAAPKSNASYVALQRARQAVAQQEAASVPPHLRSTALRGSKERMGAGEGYFYPHDFPEHYVEQEYLPPGFKDRAYYEPTQQGVEARLATWLRHLRGEEEILGQSRKSPDKI
jgi:putative ATPase